MPLHRTRRQGNTPDPMPVPLVIPFPVRGVDHSLPVAQQPPLTCPDALNVVSFPSLSDRGGGGKRDGTSKESLVSLGGTVVHLQTFLATQSSPSASGGGSPTSWSDMNMGLNAAGNWLETYVSPLSLHVGGQFTLAGGATSERFAIYSTAAGTWTDPANSFSTSQDNPARAVLWDAGDGSGTCLYAVGGVGSTPTINRVARWNGTTWMDLLLSNTGVTSIHGICVYLGKLYVCGVFTALNGTTATNIGYWDPASAIGTWTALTATGGQGVTGGAAYCMAVMSDILYVGGAFTAAGGVAANRNAEWNFATSTWRSIGNIGAGPQTSGIGTVLCMTVADIGNGTKLYIGGSFGNWNNLNIESLAAVVGLIDGFTASDHSMITSWDGHKFAPLISGLRGNIGVTTDLLDYGVSSIEVYNDGLSPGVWVAGRFNAASSADGLGLPAPSVAKWDGNVWTAPPLGLAGGTAQTVRHMIPAGAATNQHLYATGSFTTKNNVAASGIAMWDGDVWSCFFGAGIPNPQFGAGKCSLVQVVALLHDDVPKLYMGISHTTPATYSYIAGCGSAPPVPGSRGSRYSLCAWDGTRFGEIPGWTDYLLNPAGLLRDNIASTGYKLWVCGGATEATGAPRNYIAVWDGSSWAGLNATSGQSALNDEAYDLATDGSSLFVAGKFTTANNAGVGVAHTKLLAKYDPVGNTWTALTAVTNTGTTADAVLWDSGGSLLYIGGTFSLLGGVANTVNVGTWSSTGPTFAPLDQGLNNRVLDIVVFGGSFYACGTFTADGRGTAMNYIARWDSGTTRWVILGGGLSGGDTAHCMFVHDDGSGSKLYVGGNFTGATNGAGTITTNGIASWDGTNWHAVDRTGSTKGGFGGLVLPPRVTAMGTWLGQLIAMGGFTDVSGEAASYVARGEA